MIRSQGEGCGLAHLGVAAYTEATTSEASPSLVRRPSLALEWDHSVRRRGRFLRCGYPTTFRTLGIPVLELDDRPRLLKALIGESVKAVGEDGAHLIIFGCTGMAGLAQQVEDGVRENGIGDVPVLDRAVLALNIAEALAEVGLSHSKRTYPVPPEKEIVCYELRRRES